MDFEESSTKLVSHEFLAVVLAGFGNELVPLTNDHGDEPCPKALLPVANRPMIDFPLTWLEQSGITEVLLICPTTHRSSISHHIHSDTSSSSYPSLHVDVQTYEESPDEPIGTCAVLKHFSSRIQRDFVVLPCDFVPPEGLSLTSILNKYRIESNLDGAIVTSCWLLKVHGPDRGAIPGEWGSTGSCVPIIWDKKSGTLLHIDTPDDRDRNSNELEIRMSLLSRYPVASLSSQYTDSHVYVCKRSILDILHQKSTFDSFREEFLPWLCKIQYQKTKQEKYGRVLRPIQANATHALALRHSTLFSGPLLPQDPSSRGSSSPSFKPVLLRIGIVVHDTGFAGRVNNIATLLEVNRQFLTRANYTLPTDPENRALIDAKSQISSDSMIGSSTKIGERATIKRSVIGRHCVIGKMARVVGSVLLDHCVILDGAKLEGCILGRNTRVGAKAELVRSLTQAGYEVDAGATIRNEKLEVSDWTAGPQGTDSDGVSQEDEGL
ncbi:UDP-3-O-glucosamine N-acyltransferase [Multifurca ochricompacta]|uniref:Translation initiation factor eIF2B subunit gamma n=1 Tax=Multifurca ochricompacta TaxID=376703 RepID=A0AAD4M979_9AGAM|nr:UDP-3-O-glucosamine N-acyltransferase [Multifurca ochricompacta]